MAERTSLTSAVDFCKEQCNFYFSEEQKSWELFLHSTIPSSFIFVLFAAVLKFFSDTDLLPWWFIVSYVLAMVLFRGSCFWRRQQERKRWDKKIREFEEKQKEGFIYISTEKGGLKFSKE